MHRMERGKVSLCLLLMVGCLTAFTPAVCSADGRVNYTYIPEDKIGDFRVYVDDMRYLRGSWKGINLFHRCGEIHSPLTWGFLKGTSFKGATVYQPDNIKDMIWEYQVPDLPVRVTKTKDKTEYFWSYSYRQSDFSKSDQYLQLLPERRSYLHLESDFKQINRVEITKNRIIFTTTMVFLNPPIDKHVHARPSSDKVIFYPVIFPGTGKNRAYIKEFRILGKECIVIDNDGKVQTTTYPKEIKSKVWLNNEPRSLIFNLEDIGKIRYNFSFSDPEISLLFYAHTGWPSPSLNPYVCPAIVAKIVIPAKEKFKDGIYKCSMKMEVIVGDAVNEKPGVEAPSELPVYEHLDIGIETKRSSYRFFTDDPLRFNIVLDGLKSDESRKLSLVTSVLDYENQEINRQKLHLSLPKDAEKPLELQLPSIGKGAFILSVEALEKNKVVGFKAQRFCVLDRPYAYPSEKSLFGCTNGWMRRRGSDEKFYDTCNKELSLLYDLGIKKFRWLEGYVTWALVEKEQGKYEFPPPSKQLILAKEAKIDCFMDGYGSFEGARFVPEWAKSGKKTKYDCDIPKDFKDYENYCYEVAKRFKGIINTFELENEPNLVRYEKSEERKEYIEIKAKILSTAYRGIKRGNPDALVVGGTLGCTDIPALEWLEDLLEYAKSKEWKLFDIMAPHYLVRTVDTPPEDKLDNIILARNIADKYNLILWNGEDGNTMDPFHNIYPNTRFIRSEKEYAIHSVRSYLLQKSFNVEHINLCHASSRSPRELPMMEYEASQAGYFCGMGGFIKPWAVAHATLAQILEGSSFRERIDLGFKDAWCMVYTRGSDTMAAVWMKEGEAKWNVTLPKGTEYRNIVGASKKIDGKQQFTLTEEPFYLVAKEKVGEKLITSLKGSRLIPDKLIELGKISFTEDRKELEVQIRNYSGAPLKIDSVELSYGKKQISLNKVTISADEYTYLRFVPEKEIKSSVMAKVVVEAGSKTYKKEEFVLFPSLRSARAMGYLIAVKAKGPVKIDGELSEWKEAVPIILNRKAQVIYDEIKAEDLGGWSGPDDLSAVGYVMWDDENFYFACKVTDDTYANPYPDGMSSTWNCDSIQMSIDPLMDNTRIDRYYNDDDQEINLALNQKGPAYWRRTFGTKYRDKRNCLADGQVPGAELSVKKWEKGLVYEFKIPVKELYPLKVKSGTMARFNFIVNEDDGRNREMWIGVTPGIGERKAPQVYKKVYFYEEK